MSKNANTKSVALTRKFKEKVFHLFHNLILFKDIPPNLGVILILLQMIQSVILTFNSKNELLERYFFAEIVKRVDAIQLYPLVTEYFNTDARIVMNIVLLSYVFIIWLSLVMLAFRKDFAQNVGIQNLAYILGFLYEITTKFLFIPIFGTFITTIKCGDGVTCFAGGHLILIFSSVGGIILLLIASYTIDAFFFDFSFKSKDSLAHAPVQDFVLGFIYKTLAVILTVGIFDFEYNSVVALYHCLFNLLFLYNSVKKVTYFNMNVHVAYLIQTAILIWVNGAFIVVNLMNASSFSLLRDNTIIIIIVGAYFFVSLCLNLREKIQDTLLTKEGSELESDILLDAKVRFFLTLAKSAQNKSQADLLLASLMKIHVDHCDDVRCPCKLRESLYDPKTNTYGDKNLNPHKDNTFIKHFIYHILRTGSAKFFTSELLFLDSVFFLFESMRNYPQAYHLIHLYEKKNISNSPRIIMQFLIFRLYAKMKDYVAEKNNKVTTKSLSYDKVIEFDEELANLKTMIFSQIEHSINVWEMIDSEFPDLNILNKLLENAFNHKERVIQQYEKTVKVNDQSLELKVIMDTYARYVAYDDQLAVKVDKDIETRVPMDNQSDNFNFDRDMDLWNIFDENCYTIEIANQMDRLGQIINFSKNTLPLLGYQDQELRFQNVKILLPKCIGVQHDRILREFFENGKDGGLRKPIHNFSMNSKGNCFSVHLIIKAIPMLGYYRLMALFRKLNQYDYIVTDDKGIIDSFGEKVADLLEITPQQAQQAKLNLALIAPKVIKYFHHYLLKKIKDMDVDLLSKPKSFYICIPANWKSFLQRWQERKKAKNGMSLPSMNSGFAEEEEGQDVEDYFDNMLEYMRKDKRNLKKVIKVKAIIEHMELRDGEIRMKSIKIISHKVKRPDEVPIEKLRKQEELISVLAHKIRKILDQRRIEMAHKLELAKHIAKQKEAEEADAIELDEENKKETPKDTKKIKANWNNLVEKTKRQTPKNVDKSVDTLMHTETKEFERLPREEFSDDRDGTLENVSRSETGSQITIIRTETDKTLTKKSSILKKSSFKDQDSIGEKGSSVLDRFKKRVKILQKTKKEKAAEEKAKQEKKAKKEKTGHISLITDESSSDDEHEIADHQHVKSVNTELPEKKKAKNEFYKDLLDDQEIRGLLQKRNAGPASVASSTNSSIHSKDFSSRIKNLLKGTYIPASLRTSNKSEIVLTLIVLIFINILSALIRHKVGVWVDSIKTMNTPNFYEVFLFRAQSSYLTLALISQGALDQTLYDTTWVTTDQALRQQTYYDIHELMFSQIKSITTQEDLMPLYFNKITFNILTKGAYDTLKTDFLGYLGFVTNAINATLYYPITDYYPIVTNEYLFTISNNFKITVTYLDEEKDALKDRIGDILSYSKALIVAEAATSIGIIICSLLIILPMFLQHNLHLEGVLVLFTNISKKDSDFFFKHYRSIRLTWNQHYDNFQALQKDVVLNAKLEDAYRKKSKLNAFSKNRPFLRLKRNYKKFTIIISVSILVFTALAAVKAVVTINGLSNIKAYAEEFTLLSEEASTVFKILHNYKMLLARGAVGITTDPTQVTEFKSRLSQLDLSVEFRLAINIQTDLGISSSNVDALQDILIGDLCDYYTDTSVACSDLLDGILTKGYLTVRYELFSYISNNFNRWLQVTDVTALADISKSYLNEKDLKDFALSWNFIQQLLFDWLTETYGNVQNKKGDIIDTFNLFLGFLSFCLFMNLVTWRYSYLQLIGTLLKFHRYFEILPLELMRDNRSIRSYFEKYFKIKEKN